MLFPFTYFSKNFATDSTDKFTEQPLHGVGYVDTF